MSDDFIFPQICEHDITECIICRKRHDDKKSSSMFTYNRMRAENLICDYSISVEHTIKRAGEMNENRSFIHPWMFDVAIFLKPRYDMKFMELTLHIMNGRVGYIFVPHMSSDISWPREIKEIGYDVVAKHELEQFFRFLVPVAMLNITKLYSFNNISTNWFNDQLRYLLLGIREHTGSWIRDNFPSQFYRNKLVQREIKAVNDYLDEVLAFVKTLPAYSEIYSYLKQVQVEPPFKYIAHYVHHTYDRTYDKWYQTISTCFGNINVKNS